MEQESKTLNLVIKACSGMVNVDTSGDRESDTAFSYAKIGCHHSGIQVNTEDKVKRSSLLLMSDLIASAVNRYMNPKKENNLESTTQCQVIDLMDGKYTFILGHDGTQEALRYGEPWQKQELIGNNLTRVMAQEIVDLKATISTLNKQLENDGPTPR